MAAKDRTHLRIIALATVLGVALAGVIFLDFGASSPGPISAVHDGIDELRGSAGCVACHGDEDQTLAQACTKCHSDIGTQLETHKGLHGQLEPHQATNCGHCHMEHRGASFDPAGHRAFIAAGIADGLQGFKHEGFDFALTGKHDELKCVKCHTHADDRILEKGCKRFLGLRQDCTACHEDPHDGKLPGCAECHGQEHPFEQAALFEHDIRVPLVGSHANLACKSCHDPKSAHAIETLGARRDAGEEIRVRECAECHESAHAETFLVAVAATANVPSQRTCEVCHDLQHESFYASDVEASRRLHASTGLTLTAPHEKLDCKACHEGIGAVPPKDVAAAAAHEKRFPGRDASKCTSCHESSHTDAFLGKVAEIAKIDSGRSCELCHGTVSRDFWSIDDAANRRLHIAAGFELVPPHDRADCKECHAGIGEATKNSVSAKPIAESHDPAYARRFPGRNAQQCSACHEDPHGDQFTKGAFAGANCNDCHDPLTFRPAAFTAQLHAKTRFPLTGAHQAVGCRVCHETATPDAHPVFAGVPTECAKCHVDVHDGQFDTHHLPKTHRGATGCARCHDTESFRLRKNQTFDHGKWTGYALVGGHARAACSKCHLATKPTHDGTRHFGKAPNGCADCHADAHAGQFAVRGRTDCAKCHTPNAPAEWVVFDHGKHSRFKLDGYHEELACAKCHKPHALPNGRKVVRYKPLGTKCGNCHGWQTQREYEARKRERKR